MTTSRKLFSENVAIPGTVTSMETIMKTAGWGFQSDANNAISTVPSLDSFTGNSGSLLPAADVYVGHDEFVRNAAAAGPPRLYKGVLASGTVKFNLEDFCRGIVDPAKIWLYAPGGATTADLVFNGF